MSSSDLPLYLVKNENLITIEDRVVIARKEGNVSIKLDTQTKIWECIPSGKPIFVDGAEIAPGFAAPLHSGSILKISDDEYKVFSSREEAESIIPKLSRRKNKRPKHPYDPLNFVHFFAAPPWALGIYAALFAMALTRFLPKIKISSQVSEELNFLVENYNAQSLSTTMWLIVLTYVTCLLHSFLMYVYFNRTAGRRFVGAVGLCLFTVLGIYQTSKNLKEIDTYLSVREAVLSKHTQPEEMAINHMKKYVGFRASMTDAFDTILPSVPTEQQPALVNDFSENMALIDAELKSELK